MEIVILEDSQAIANPPPEAPRHPFVNAVAKGDLVTADDVLATLPDILPPWARRAAGELHLRRRRWKQAAETFATVLRPDTASEIRRCLCANLADMAEYHPEIYRRLIEAAPDSSFPLIRGKAGRLTLATTDEAGRSVPLSRGGDSLSSTVQALLDLKAAWKSGCPLTLCGLGDGFVLTALARFSPAPVASEPQTVFVIEPDIRLVMAAMLLQDFAGPDGPIRQPRFHWFVGSDWAEQFDRRFSAEPHLPFPQFNFCQGPSSTAVESIVAAKKCKRSES